MHFFKEQFFKDYRSKEARVEAAPSPSAPLNFQNSKLGIYDRGFVKINDQQCRTLKIRQKLKFTT